MVYGKYICHHGIKGQRWGVRRFQNKDGSLTSAGERRYNTDLQGAKERVKKAKQKEKEANLRFYKETGYGMIYNKKAIDRLEKSTRETKWAKQDLESEKIKVRLNNENKAKSQHRLKLEEHYLKKGMNSEEAEIAAYKRDKTEKILAVTAGMTVAAASAYVVYKGYEKRVDKIINAGTTLQNISSDSNKGVSDAFYASMTKMDNIKYRGIYGSNIRQANQKVYQTKIGVNKALKVASEKHAVDAISELVKDPKYAVNLEEHLTKSIGRYPLQKQNDTVRKGLASLKKGKINSKVYDALNLTLVDHQLSTSSYINQGFYDKLKSKGYDAIMDVNDMKLSGFHSKKPIIVFNGQVKTSVNNIEQLGQQAIKKAQIQGMMDVTIREAAKSASEWTAAISVIRLASKIDEGRKNDKIVREYRQKHPNSELSYNEILRSRKK